MFSLRGGTNFQILGNLSQRTFPRKWHRDRNPERELQLFLENSNPIFLAEYIGDVSDRGGSWEMLQQSLDGVGAQHVHTGCSVLCIFFASQSEALIVAPRGDFQLNPIKKNLGSLYAFK